MGELTRKGRPRLETQCEQQVHISHLLFTRALVERTNSRISMVTSHLTLLSG